MTDKAPFNPEALSWRAVRAAVETYRDEVDELQQANWTGDLFDSQRRIRALLKLSQSRTTEEIEALARLPRSR